jgi:hypothetical protein
MKITVKNEYNIFTCEVTRKNNECMIRINGVLKVDDPSIEGQDDISALLMDSDCAAFGELLRIVGAELLGIDGHEVSK